MSSKNEKPIIIDNDPNGDKLMLLVGVCTLVLAASAWLVTRPQVVNFFFNLPELILQSP